MSALPSSRKTHSEKHKQILRQLLKEAPNKNCVDCKTAGHPRWASWNLGCFICIRCSGIHRSMGTHISRVKSVDLDVWTDEQVESMVKWGNAKCNLYWEAKLPDNYVPDGSKIENFIRTKYDMRKWAASSKTPDPLTLSATSSSAPTSVPAVSQPSPSNHINSTQPVHKAAATNLLDDDFGSFSSAPQRNMSPAVAQATPKPVASQESKPTTPSPPVPQKSRQGNQRTDLKKSILSLYSTPTSSSSSFHTSSQVQPSPSPRFSAGNTPSPNPQAAGSNSVSNLSDSLLGLSFGSEQKVSNPVSKSVTPSRTDSALSMNSQPASVNKATSSAEWGNEWNDNTSTSNQWTSTSRSKVTTPTFSDSFSAGTFGKASTPGLSTSTNDLENDLYKNVWS